MSSFLSKVCNSAIQDFVIMGFIKTRDSRYSGEDSTQVREKERDFCGRIKEKHFN